MNIYCRNILSLFFILFATAHALYAGDNYGTDARGCLTPRLEYWDVPYAAPQSVDLACVARDEKHYIKYFFLSKASPRDKLPVGFGLVALFQSRNDLSNVLRVHRHLDPLLAAVLIETSWRDQNQAVGDTNLRIGGSELLLAYLRKDKSGEDFSGEENWLSNYASSLQHITNGPSMLDSINAVLFQAPQSFPAYSLPDSHSPIPTASSSLGANHDFSAGMSTAVSTVNSSCHPLSQYVSVEVRAMTGPGHCTGEVDVWITNRSSEVLTCEVMFHHNGSFSGPGSMGDSVPGQRQGGFSGGLWTCQSDRNEVRHVCFSKAESSAPGSDCWGQGKINWNE